MEIKFIKVFLKNTTKKIMIWNIYFLSKSQLPAPKEAVLVCAVFFRQGAACLHSVLTQFFAFSPMALLLWSEACFAEAFHVDVQYTKLPLIQTETLSYKGSWGVFFYVPKMCNTNILDLNRRIFREQWCRLWNFTEGPDKYLFSAHELRPFCLFKESHTNFCNISERSKWLLKRLSYRYSLLS